MEVSDFIKWFNNIDNYAYKIFIAGNHDMSFDREILLRDKLAHFEGRTEYDTECAEGKPQWLIDLFSFTEMIREDRETVYPSITLVPEVL